MKATDRTEWLTAVMEMVTQTVRHPILDSERGDDVDRHIGSHHMERSLHSGPTH